MEGMIKKYFWQKSQCLDRSQSSAAKSAESPAPSEIIDITRRAGNKIFRASFSHFGTLAIFGNCAILLSQFENTARRAPDGKVSSTLTSK